MVLLSVKKQLNGSVNESYHEPLDSMDIAIPPDVDKTLPEDNMDIAIPSDIDKTAPEDSLDIVISTIMEKTSNEDNTDIAIPLNMEKTFHEDNMHIVLSGNMENTYHENSMDIAIPPNLGNPCHAIFVKEVVASYGSGKGKHIVLDNFNMEVATGTTFALLGSSGCGKTTLLSCVVGRKALDSGRILVLGGRPGDRSMGMPGRAVGYMPQELCLYMEFSIKETLRYFGRIYGMSGCEVRGRLEFLSSLLDLPDEDRRVWSLSGGQRRRVSLAVALVHSPPLLILDEPTVGLDPLVRQSIWAHLTGLAKERVTSVITTHYIEEAREADTAAIMRGGRLLTQENPDVLLQKFGCPTLEKVFLSLCKFDKSDQNKLRKVKTKARFEPSITTNHNQIFTVSHQKAEITAENRKDNNEGYPKYCREKYPNIPSINNLAALLIKNMTRMLRNVPMLLFIFLLPAIFIVFFCTAVGRDPQHLPLAVSYPNHHQCIQSTPQSVCLSYSMACVFLTFLNSSSSISPILFSNKSSAILEVRKGKAWGVLHIPSNFSSKFFQTFSPSAEGFTDKIDISLDMSNQQIAFILQKSLGRALENTISHLGTACQINETNNIKMFHYEAPIFGSTDPSFTEFLAPGIVVLIIYFLAMSLTGEAFIIERSQGLLERSLIAGVRPAEILASYIISQFLVMIIQTTVTLLTIIYIFSLPCRGPAFTLILLTILQGLAGMSFGFFISTISDDILIAMKLAIGSFFPNLLLSGIIWPVEGMPAFLQEVVWFLPSTATVQAMRDVMGRGWGMDMSSVYTGALISSAWILVFLIISWIMVKIKLK